MPVLLNWMVHANVFESDAPAVIWGHGHQHHERERGHARRPRYESPA